MADKRAAPYLACAAGKSAALSAPKPFPPVLSMALTAAGQSGRQGILVVRLSRMYATHHCAPCLVRELGRGAL